MNNNMRSGCGRFLSVLGLLFLLLWHPVASAEFFWWQVNGIDRLRDKPFGSPGEGCSAVLAYFQSQGGEYSFSLNFLRRISDEEFSCLRISEHRDRPFRLIVTAHFANA